MAVLQQPVSISNPFADQIGNDLPPVGTFVATIVDISDEFGVKRTKFQSAEIETVDMTCFLFGFRDAAGNPHRIASRRMKISGAETSALYGFLKSLLGKAPPYNWDYCTLKGSKCLLTVEHVQKRDGSGVFANIAALSPLPAGYEGHAPAPTLAPQQSMAAPPVSLPNQPALQPEPSTAATQQEDEVPF